MSEKTEQKKAQKAATKFLNELVGKIRSTIEKHTKKNGGVFVEHQINFDTVVDTVVFATTLVAVKYLHVDSLVRADENEINAKEIDKILLTMLDNVAQAISQITDIKIDMNVEKLITRPLTNRPTNESTH